MSSGSASKNARSELLDLAQIEHQAKMKKIQLKHDILLLKKSKLEMEIASMQSYVVVANNDVNYVG